MARSLGMGIRTVDVGVPQLSMHSVREMCGTVGGGVHLGFFKVKACLEYMTREREPLNLVHFPNFGIHLCTF